MPDFDPDTRIPEALGQSEAFLTFQQRLSRVAGVDRPVLILGERGTGKELAARRLHYLSSRWEEPLVTLNCAALSPTLIEAELFGHEAGAFTGATRQRVGRFEAADRGTLFLDEIGNIPVVTQEKILRVVEYHTFERVGSSERTEVDARIVGATNRDLRARAREGRFKQDLLDRLSFEVLLLPPLREREGDVLLLAHHFAARMAHELGREELPEFSLNVARALEAYDWPGNVRELKNVVERAVYAADGPAIRDIVFDPFASAGSLATAAVPDAMRESDAHAPTAPEASGAAARSAESVEAGEACEACEAQPDPFARPFPEAVQELEVALLKQALAVTRYNQRQAARRLGLTYHQFRGLYRKYKDAVAGS